MANQLYHHQTNNNRSNISTKSCIRHPHNNTSIRSLQYADDPDSYIIGDRVWVQGVKPGYIVYIGEVQFAKGEWAGVVLDHPEGKNDGSVHGVRYFQCPPNRGLFTRLHRLTRYPIDTIDVNNNPISTTATAASSSTTTTINNKSDNNNDNNSIISNSNRTNTKIKTHRICSSDGKITTTVTRITKLPAKIPSSSQHYSSSSLSSSAIKPTKVITTVTTTTTTVEKQQQPQPKSVLKSSYRLTSSSSANNNNNNNNIKDNTNRLNNQPTAHHVHF